MRISGSNPGQSAILAMLLLRGPQTVGKLRAPAPSGWRPSTGWTGWSTSWSSSRPATSRSSASVGRRPGQKEERWTSPLLGFALAGGDAPHPADVDEGPETDAAPSLTQLVDDLRAEVTGLRSDVAQLRHELDKLRASLGG